MQTVIFKNPIELNNRLQAVIKQQLIKSKTKKYLNLFIKSKKTKTIKKNNLSISNVKLIIKNFSKNILTKTNLKLNKNTKLNIKSNYSINNNLASETNLNTNYNDNYNINSNLNKFHILKNEIQETLLIITKNKIKQDILIKNLQKLNTISSNYVIYYLSSKNPRKYLNFSKLNYKKNINDELDEVLSELQNFISENNVFNYEKLGNELNYYSSNLKIKNSMNNKLNKFLKKSFKYNTNNNIYNKLKDQKNIKIENLYWRNKNKYLNNVINNCIKNFN